MRACYTPHALIHLHTCIFTEPSHTHTTFISTFTDTEACQKPHLQHFTHMHNITHALTHKYTHYTEQTCTHVYIYINTDTIIHIHTSQTYALHSNSHTQTCPNITSHTASHTYIHNVSHGLMPTYMHIHTDTHVYTCKNIEILTCLHTASQTSHTFILFALAHLLTLIHSITHFRMIHASTDIHKRT